MLKIHLPYPPSANKLWRPVGPGKLARTKYYQGWLLEARWVVAMAVRDRGMIRGPFSLHMIAHAPDKRRRDLDNLLKATLDALKDSDGHGVMAVEDDSLAQFIAVSWGELPDGPGVLVEINPYGRTDDTRGPGAVQGQAEGETTAGDPGPAA